MRREGRGGGEGFRGRREGRLTSCEISVQTILEQPQVGARKRSCGGELVQREAERGQIRILKVDVGERHISGCHVGHRGNGGRAAAGDVVLDRRHHIGNFTGQHAVADDEAGRGLTGDVGCKRGAEKHAAGEELNGNHFQG